MWSELCGSVWGSQRKWSEWVESGSKGYGVTTRPSTRPRGRAAYCLRIVGMVGRGSTLARRSQPRRRLNASVVDVEPEPGQAGSAGVAEVRQREQVLDAGQQRVVVVWGVAPRARRDEPR